jgi:hypothetical protein
MCGSTSRCRRKHHRRAQDKLAVNSRVTQTVNSRAAPRRRGTMPARYRIQKDTHIGPFDALVTRADKQQTSNWTTRHTVAAANKTWRPLARSCVSVCRSLAPRQRIRHIHAAFRRYRLHNVRLPTATALALALLQCSTRIAQQRIALSARARGGWSPGSTSANR